jgi:hypothetical protein
LWILAAGSILVGLLGVPDALIHGADRFGAWLTPVLAAQARDESAKEFILFALIATGVSLGGIGIAYALYGHGFSPRVRSFVARVPRLYKVVLNKFYIDEIYDTLIVRPLRWTALILWKAVDTFLIDLVFVNGAGFLTSGVGKLAKYVQNGDVQRYVIGIVAGAALMLWGATNWSARSAAKFEATAEGSEVTVNATSGGPTAKRLMYRIDWDGGKKFGAPQPATTFKHRYDTPGKKKISLQVLDPRWGTDATETKTVVVK